MSDEPTCPQCGTRLPNDAPRGLCPVCLIRAGLESEPGPDSAANHDHPAFQPTIRSPAGASSRFEPPALEVLQPLFPHLEFLDLLGKGGMGAVYKARQRELDRLVAVKILPAEIGDDQAFVDRFLREARALARLSHNNIVAIYDFGQAGSLFYIVMEYVDGANLRQTIQAAGLTPPEALSIVPQICEALQFAHDEGIVHRDIKPENILIDKRGRVKIADFGLAKLLGSDNSNEILTGTHQVMGTLRYMAPEQMQGSREVDHRADIFSLGVVFYELLTGELPLGRFAPPSKKVQLDIRLDEVVLRALEQDPQQRYQHASDVKHEIDSIRTTVSPPASVSANAGTPSLKDMGPELGPRFSRFAIAGAVWAIFGLLSVVPILFFIGLNRVWNGTALPTDVIYESPPLPFTIFMGALLVVGAGAPIGTTVYGAVAIGHIKRSGGKIIGLPLAVFDVLFFPLLTLFVGIALPASLALHALLPLQLIAVAVPSVIIACVACWSIALAVWRKLVPAAPGTAATLRDKLRLAGTGVLIAGLADAFASCIWIGTNVSELWNLWQQSAPLSGQILLTLLSLTSMVMVYYVTGIGLWLMKLEEECDPSIPLLCAALVPPGCLIGLPAAIYAFVQLSKPEAKALFPPAVAD